MTIPQRLKPYHPNKEEFTKMDALLLQIEDAIFDHNDENDPDTKHLIAQWNKIANREFEFHEFRDLHSYTDNVSFIYSAFYQIKYIEDLSFDEAIRLVNAISESSESESDGYYLVNLLEKNFPDSNISDLIFWPDDWFQDEEFEDELTSAEILGYAMARSGRYLPDSPEIELKHPIPQH
ncbi:hypothetical protein Xsto_01395 [Xenorhabdus stockiae]|uniref:Uncharacterized protein n=1 Tax=Xenorhabdus stockiae TaxID=351614 RepID=A0A2D0KRX0_9GAMM|nr:hypothetical protein [Xenorhabdus stockiae]PHM66170.1 hypothetical protein Xsto_01395 [Xenorhabdus stockiae]